MSLLGGIAEPVRTRGKPSRGELSAGRALKHKLTTSEEIRDIGPAPPVKNPRRRKRAIAELEFFLKTYFPRTFHFPFSDDHRRMIALLQQIATDGGLGAFAMPRGQGKTQIVIRTAIWAVLSGRRRFPCMIGATQSAARDLLEAVSVEISSNAMLYDDFPCELHGLPQLQEDNRKALKQHCQGQLTHPRIGSDKLIFPRIEGSLCAGARISTCGITGKIRGQFHTQRGGGTVRPDFVIPDDPQTAKSAQSAILTEKRLSTLRGDILGLSGPGTRIACAMPCTVIQKDDMADQILRDPAWRGIRTKTLYSFPANLKKWDEYFELHAECLRVDGNAKRSNQMYRDNRAEMDAGAQVAWEHRKDAGDLSALQTAMHRWHEGRAEFAAEFQNEPVDLAQSLDVPTFAGLSEKITRLPRGVAPVWATKITLGIDVQQRCLFWLVAAWADDFTGSVIDYGAWPQQSRAYFGLGDVAPTLQQASGRSQIEAAWRWGLDGLAAALLSQPLKREGTGEIAIGRAMVDANYGLSTDTVYEFCRRSPFGGVIMPSHGRGVKAGHLPMAQWPSKPGETHGRDWIITPGDNKRAIRHVKFDTDSWKSMLAERAGAAPGERGALSIFGERPEQHRMLFDHLASESPVKTFGRGREVWEWTKRPNADNHWLDCLVLAGVAASMLGCVLPGASATPDKPKRVSFSKMQQARR